MITLRELLQLNETVTLLSMYVRRPDGTLIRRSIIGRPYKLSSLQLDDIDKGKLEYIDADINKHGRQGRSGMSEMIFSMDWKAIPKQYLDAEITDISWIHERYGNDRGSELGCTIVPVQLNMDCAWNRPDYE